MKEKFLFLHEIILLFQSFKIVLWYSLWYASLIFSYFRCVCEGEGGILDLTEKEKKENPADLTEKEMKKNPACYYFCFIYA